MFTLQDLLDALARGDDIASVLSNLDPSVDLSALESEALSAFDTLYESVATDEDVAALESLGSAVEALQTEQTRRDEAVTERAAAASAIAARVRPGQASADTGDAADGDADDGDDAGDEPADGDADGQASVDEPEEDAVVAASAGRSRVDLAAVKRRAPRPVAPAEPSGLARVAMAAADVPGVPTGAPYTSYAEMAKAAERRIQALPLGQTGVKVRVGLGVFNKQVDPALTVSGDRSDFDVIEQAADESRLPGGSLLAAGGWCAPSETLYDLCEMETTDGLYMLPEVTATRGGIRHTPGPDFCEIFGMDAYWDLTETQVDAETQKPCAEIACPEFEEERLRALGVCVTAGILTRRGYPELIARVIRGALVSHAHRMSEARLTDVIAASDDHGVMPECGGATASVLGAIELQAEDMKYRERLSRNQTIEVVLPYWLRGVIREDLSKRNGLDRLEITDAVIDGLFRLRGVQPQFTYSLDPLGACPGSPLDPVTTWPADLRVVMYPSGTFVAATSDIITLDTIYDSTNIRTNRYTALFSEEGQAVLKRCHDARLFAVPLCPSGESGAQVACACES